MDRFRTALNVLGDAIGTAIVYHLSKAELEAMVKYCQSLLDSGPKFHELQIMQKGNYICCVIFLRSSRLRLGQDRLGKTSPAFK